MIQNIALNAKRNHNLESFNKKTERSFVKSSNIQVNAGVGGGGCPRIMLNATNQHTLDR